MMNVALEARSFCGMVGGDIRASSRKGASSAAQAMCLSFVPLSSEQLDNEPVSGMEVVREGKNSNVQYCSTFLVAYSRLCGRVNSAVLHSITLAGFGAEYRYDGPIISTPPRAMDALAGPVT